MKDIPLFTTPYGTASLSLKEIPYKALAYVRVVSAQRETLEDLLKACIQFCRMAGAERVFATGHPGLESYPAYTSVVEMRGEAVVDKASLVSLFPVTEATVGHWRNLYNEKMRDVDNAGTLTAFDEEEIVSSGGAYFVHRAGDLLGIGWMDDTKLLAIASTKPGEGRTVMNALLSMVEEASVTLEVASTNRKAIRLYEKLGFMKVRNVSTWYQVY